MRRKLGTGTVHRRVRQKRPDSKLITQYIYLSPAAAQWCKEFEEMSMARQNNFGAYYLFWHEHLSTQLILSVAPCVYGTASLVIPVEEQARGDCCSISTAWFVWVLESSFWEQYAALLAVPSGDFNC